MPPEQQEQQAESTTPLALRRLELLEQLATAKELRLRMEEHCQKARQTTFHSERWAILQQAVPDMMQISVLQDALNDGFALKDYQHYHRTDDEPANAATVNDTAMDTGDAATAVETSTPAVSKVATAAPDAKK